MKHFSKGNSKQHDIEKLSNPFVFRFFNRLDNNVLRFLIIEEPLRNILKVSSKLLVRLIFSVLKDYTCV